MNHWPFVIASYVIVIFGTAIVVAMSYAAMRKSEQQVQAMTTAAREKKTGT
ncbi:hypothetical protein [Parasphingorhabdus sp.]|uniref:hypothetical protein n=1 Tax=Parasphingorhabdus sp. TaxID=2709688 RepID=UPI0032633D7C